MSERFGLWALDLRVKVTNDPRKAGSMTIVPGSIGFKQKDGTWVNEWMDVILPKGSEEIPAKGDRLTVTGRVDCSEWQGKKQWKVWAEMVTIEGSQPSAPSAPPPDDETDCPF